MKPLRLSLKSGQAAPARSQHCMKQLKDRDWINEREKKKTGKRRPNKIYSLKVSFKDIIAQLEKQQMEAVDKTQTKIEKLKEMGGH